MITYILRSLWSLCESWITYDHLYIYIYLRYIYIYIYIYIFILFLISTKNFNACFIFWLYDLENLAVLMILKKPFYWYCLFSLLKFDKILCRLFSDLDHFFYIFFSACCQNHNLVVLRLVICVVWFKIFIKTYVLRNKFLLSTWM